MKTSKHIHECAMLHLVVDKPPQVLIICPIGVIVNKIGMLSVYNLATERTHYREALFLKKIFHRDPRSGPITSHILLWI